MKKTVCLVLVFVFSVFGCNYAFADDYNYSSGIYSKSDLWAYYGDQAITKGLGGYWFGELVGDLAGGLIWKISDANGYCTSSPDSLHHCRDGVIHDNGVDQYGSYAVLHCAFCGGEFRCYNSDFGDSIEQAYTSVVDDLGIDEVDDEGGLFWKPSLNDCEYAYHHWVTSNTSSEGHGYHFYVGSIEGYRVKDRSTLIYNSGLNYFGVSSNVKISSIFGSSAAFTLKTPVSGYYTYVDSVSTEYSYNGNSSSTYYKAGTNTHHDIDEKILFSSSVDASKYDNWSFTYYLPEFKVVPDNRSEVDNIIENIKLYNLALNLAQVNNNAIVGVYKNTHIIDDDNMTLTDPTTGNSYVINNYTYNFNDRSISGDLDINGTLIPFLVSYLDDLVNIKINDLGIDLGLNYVVEQEPCNHNYIISSEDYQPPTCTDTGLATYVCQKCGSSYQQIINPLGHDYEFVETVPPDPGDGDSDSEPGYDLYRCSRCGDEWRDVYMSADDESDLSWFQRWLIQFKIWLGIKLDNLDGSGPTFVYNDNSITDNSDTTTNIYDYEIQYEKADGERDAFSIRRMINKFRWVKDVFDIGKTLIATVSSDAAGAYSLDLSGLGIMDDAEEPAIDGEAMDPALDGASMMVDGAPYIPLNFSAATSSQYFSNVGDSNFLDLSWYTPYKQTVDNILSGFLWIFFCWQLFSKTPGIIGGVSMDSRKVDDVSEGERFRR